MAVDDSSKATLATKAASLRREAGDLHEVVGEDAPTCGYASQSVSNFIFTVAWKRPYRTFPVLDLNGRLAGVVSLARLARVPAGERDVVRLGDVLTPRDQALVLDPDHPLADAAQKLYASGFRLTVVAVDGHVSGVLSVGDLARAVELAALGSRPDHPGHVQVPLSDKTAGTSHR